MGRTRSLLIIMVALAVSGSAALAAAPPDLTTDAALPLRLIEIEVTVDDGNAFQVSAWEGEAVTLHSWRTGKTTALVPRILDEVVGDVEIDVLALARNKRGPARSTRLETLLGRVGFTSYLGSQAVELKVLRIRVGTLEEQMTHDARTPGIAALLGDGSILQQSGDCCVTCGMITICGCEVRARCGSCCDGCCGALAK